jgi:hypothetical protein
MDGIKRVVWLVIVSLATGTAAPGCHRSVVFALPGHHLPRPAQFPCEPNWSTSTTNLLERLDLRRLACRHPAEAFFFLEQMTEAGLAEPERLLALAELAEEASRTEEASEALTWSRDAAVYAAFSLADPRPDGTSLSTRSIAGDVHNRAVARCLRLAQTHTAASRSDWPARLAAAGIVMASRVPEWTALGFDTLRDASEFAVIGTNPRGHRDGLGVPLVAQHRLELAESDEWKSYGPCAVIFAATAVIVPEASPKSWRGEPVKLVLHDPVHDETVTVGDASLPLAADLTAPLIARLTQSSIRHYEYRGVVDPGSYSARAEVYAVDPYQPGKVPVVLVHGLWSSPAVWIPMLDALRGDPVLRARYQFWVALYPSGYPLPVAALSLRRSLREIRHRFDPQGSDPALDNMVILGKSTGGQVTRMLVEQSGDSLWNAVFARPIEGVRAAPELRAELGEMFFLEPEPYIRRVIFLTTAHRGSERARRLRLHLGVELIRRSNPLLAAWAELEAANGRALFQPFFQHRAPTSALGIEADNPLLGAIDRSPIAAGVAYHSIIANIHHKTTEEKISDGLVDYWSAHLDGAASERVVAAIHACEANPEVIAEVRRILELHLNDPSSLQ